MKNSVTITCFIFTLHAAAQVPDTTAQWYDDTAQLPRDSPYVLINPDTGVVDSYVVGDSLFVDSSLAKLDSLLQDTLAITDPVGLCISDQVTLISPYSYGDWIPIISYPWYPICGSGPAICSYTLTVIDAPSCCCAPPAPPFPMRSFEDLLNPPVEKAKPEYILLAFNADNFTPVQEKKKPAPPSPPFEPDMKWIAALYPTPFRSRNLTT